MGAMMLQKHDASAQDSPGNMSRERHSSPILPRDSDSSHLRPSSNDMSAPGAVVHGETSHPGGSDQFSKSEAGNTERIGSTECHEADTVLPDATGTESRKVNSPTPEGDLKIQNLAVAHSPPEDEAISPPENVGKPAGTRTQSETDHICANCGATETPLWRRGVGGEIVCNACGLYLRAKNKSRPVHMKRSPRTKTVFFDGEGAAGGARHDSNCGPAQPGTCPGDGQCNGAGGSKSCSQCPSFNNRLGRSKALSKNADTTATDPPRRKSGIVLVSCQNCGTTTTPLWRRDDDGNTICNACGLYLKMHHEHRPVRMSKETIKRRKRNQEPKSEETSFNNSQNTNTPPPAIPSHVHALGDSTTSHPRAPQHPGVDGMSPNNLGARVHNPGTYSPVYPMGAVPLSLGQPGLRDVSLGGNAGVLPPISIGAYGHTGPRVPPVGGSDYRGAIYGSAQGMELKAGEGRPLLHTSHTLPKMRSLSRGEQLPSIGARQIERAEDGRLGTTSPGSMPGPPRAQVPLRGQQPDLTSNKNQGHQPHISGSDYSPLAVLKYLSGDSVKEYLLAVRRQLQDKVDVYAAQLAEAEGFLQQCESKLREFE